MILLIKLAFLPVRLAFGVTGLGFKAGYRTGRLLGYRRLFVFGTGVAVGLLIAPGPGAELREKLRQRLEGGSASPPDPELADRVRFELSHSPSTSTLPQPEVDVVGGRVILRGEVTAESREVLARAAASVPGVSGVDNLLAVAGDGHKA